MWLSADRLIKNANVYVRADAAAKAACIAIGHGRILAIDDDAALDPLVGPATEIDELGGATVLPGLTDGHIHLSGYSQFLKVLDCHTPTRAQLIDLVTMQAAQVEPKIWLRGHGWDQNQWDRWPSAADFDRAAPDNPVYLTARSMHAAVCNRLALRMCGIDKRTADPADGEIVRDETGEPTGVLLEGAMSLVAEQIPEPTANQLAEMMADAQEVLWSMGLTGIHDFDGRLAFEALQLLHAQGRLGMRVLKHVQARYLEHAAGIGLRSGYGDDWLRLGNVKVFADGALGPRTAAMLQPYNDMPANQGMLLLDSEQLLEIGLRAANLGFAMTIHAIGDRANHEALLALEQLTRRFDPTHWRLPHRIEHLQLMASSDLPRPAELAVLASMQPVHAVSDQQMAQAGWGDRVGRSYAWRSIMDSGATLVFGSDAPVENPNPFWGVHAAVERRWRTEEAEPWVPEQRIPLASALLAYTVGPALAAGWGKVAGELAPGRFADLIVLREDPFQVPPEQLFQLQPRATMVGGEWRYRGG